jgi:hypothetical protein
MGEQQLRREHPAGHRLARTVEVGKDGIEQSRPLHQSGFQRVPVGGRDQQRQRVEVPRPRCGGAVAVGDGFAVRVYLDVGDAVVVDEAANHRP